MAGTRKKVFSKLQEHLNQQRSLNIQVHLLIMNDLTFSNCKGMAGGGNGDISSAIVLIHVLTL